MLLNHSRLSLHACEGEFCYRYGRVFRNTPNMSPSAVLTSTTSQAEQSVANPAYLSTEPNADFDWKISLKGKVVAITGANRGIGLGLATVCLANDATEVYSLDLFAPGEEFQALQQANPGRLHYLRCDVTVEESVGAAITAMVTTSGRIDGMIANAGMTKHQVGLLSCSPRPRKLCSPVQPALDFDRAQLEQLFTLNVYGAYFCATAAAKKFIELGIKGSIVFTASMTSYRPNRAAPSAPYGGTKGAVRNMAHTLAMEWAPHGIRVNSISPGFVRTQMTSFVDKAADWHLKMQYYGGMPRLADPRELGGAYVYLLSDCASYTTGIDIPVAGIVGAW